MKMEYLDSVVNESLRYFKAKVLTETREMMMK